MYNFVEYFHEELVIYFLDGFNKRTHTRNHSRFRRCLTLAEVKPDYTLDMRGEVCPVPDVETRRKLKSMKSGEVLEVLIDYPLSKERIPASAPKEGGEVLSIEETGPSEWRILIKKQ